LERLLTVMSQAWAPGTHETYGAGLLVFHVFCDTRNVPESLQCPASTNLILAFLSTSAGIKAWHTLHGAAWNVAPTEIAAVLEGANRLAPASSKRPPRQPVLKNSTFPGFTVVLNLTSPFDCSVRAAFAVIFWTMVRTREFIQLTLNGHNPSKFICRKDIRTEVDRNGFQVMVF
ncbi:hypothetical protein M422DRAFT_93452, partial [Sphaerobolus stellatus SS14]